MLLVSKICAAILLAGLRLLAGLLPLKVYRQLDKWSRRPDTTTGAIGSNDKPHANQNGERDQQQQHRDVTWRRKRIDLCLSVFLCFGAGLLMATCFLHMLPEVI